MGRRRLWFFILMGYLFTLGLVLPIGASRGSLDFGENLTLKAIICVPLTAVGLMVGMAALLGAQALYELFEDKPQTKEARRENYVFGTSLVVGFFAYGLLLAWLQVSSDI